ncbi:MAG: thioredoxin-disulfide reductase [Prevotellaceae bacterium]|jgi:thioredoxin reductase (NADPH)|nr:thioredoxin-disulfide reductase [Prevotellaceae bacterium]
MEHTKCLIIGSGPAGFTAAIYAARANLSPILYEGIQPGGQLTTTTEIENFPGYSNGISGPEMMEDLKNQAMRFGTDIRHGVATQADLSSRPFKVTIDGGKEILAETLIIATGATAKYLGLPSEEKFRGQGVSACATCDGFFYKGLDVAVVGGGDTACEEASYLSGLCRKVYMIVRRDVLRASKAMRERVKHISNIEILWNTQTKEILGDEMGVNAARLTHKDGSESIIDIQGFFLAIGHHPNSEVFKPWIETDENGYIITKAKTSETNVSGVFACGDVQDTRYRQGITAAGSGCMAAIDAERFLMDEADKACALNEKK